MIVCQFSVVQKKVFMMVPPEEHMAWKVPDVVEKMLPFLNLQSTVSLAVAQKKVQDVLKHDGVWRKLVTRSSPLNDREKVLKFLDILALLKSPPSHVCQVLHDICVSNPATHLGQVQIQCTLHCGTSHSVSPAGFELVEEVQRRVGATDETVKSIDISQLMFPLCVAPFPPDYGRVVLTDHFKPALKSRLSRQQENLASLKIGVVAIKDSEDCKSFKSLMLSARSTPVDIKGLAVFEPIGRKGWKTLASVVQSRPGLIYQVQAFPGCLAKMTATDLRILWEHIKPDGRFVLRFKKSPKDMFVKEDGEAGWQRLFTAFFLAEKRRANSEFAKKIRKHKQAMLASRRENSSQAS